MRKVDFSAFVHKLYEVRYEALNAGVSENGLVLYTGQEEWTEIVESVPRYILVNMIPHTNEGVMLFGIPLHTPVVANMGNAILYGDTNVFQRWAYEFEIPTIQTSNAPSLSSNSHITGREPALSRKVK